MLGRLGRLHPELEHRLDLKPPVFLFELDGEEMLAHRHPAHQPGVALSERTSRPLARA